MSTEPKSAFTTAKLMGCIVAAAVAVAAVSVVTCVPTISPGDEDGYGPDLFDAGKAQATDCRFPRRLRDVAQSEATPVFCRSAHRCGRKPGALRLELSWSPINV